MSQPCKPLLLLLVVGVQLTARAVAQEITSVERIDVEAARNVCPEPLLGPARFEPVDEFPAELAVGDLNGDGAPDVVTSNVIAGTISVLLNRGDGTFLPQIAHPVGENPRAVAIEDMNGDGAADVLVALLMDDQVALFLNSGDGSLSSPPVTIPVGVGPAGIATGDLDGDGDADLVTTDVFGDTISVVLNRGHATFHAPQSYAAGSDPVDVVLADLDGDGNTDVVVAGNTFPPTLHVLRNAGAGVLEPPTVISFFGGYAHDLDAGDLDSDGDVDVAIVSGLTDEVMLFYNDGLGNLSLEVSLPAGSLPRSVVIADLNRDGRRDVVVVYSSSQDISVWINNGSGNFIAQPHVPLGFGPDGLAVSDLDGNRFPDVVVVSSFQDVLTVLPSRCSRTVPRARKIRVRAKK